MLEDEAPMHDTRKFAEAETKRGLGPAGSELLEWRFIDSSS
jgi:hypothetical protein